jgi:carboxyl-terminal processing protease
MGATLAPVAGQQAPPPSDAQVRADIFIQSLRAIEQFHQTEFADTLLWDAAIAGMIEALDDPYAAVFTPEEVEQQDEDNTGNYAGIGVTISQLNDVVTVTAVNRGYPADRVGIIEGDVIVEVDGTDTREWTTAQVSDVIRGPVGTNVDVVVERAGYDDPIRFPITRAQVQIPLVQADYIADDILYVVMDRFARGGSEALDSILTVNADAKGIVLDLRRNPGGFLDEALKMADLFLEPGQTIAATNSRVQGPVHDLKQEKYEARVPPVVSDAPIAVLVDRYSASASEILAGALQDWDRALVLGERTFGKGLVQVVLDLPHNRRIRLTNGSWLTPLGRALHRPRDRQGRPLAEDVDTFPTISTASGRELVAAGGIFPDLEIDVDTLTTVEQDFLRAAATAQVPVPLRIVEFGFEQAQKQPAGVTEPRIDEGDFDAFLAALREEGLDATMLEDEEIEAYLHWQSRIALGDRLEGGLGIATEARMERDPVLRHAVELLTENADQRAVFAAAERERAALEQAAESTGSN